MLNLIVQFLVEPQESFSFHGQHLTVEIEFHKVETLRQNYKKNKQTNLFILNEVNQKIPHVSDSSPLPYGVQK